MNSTSPPPLPPPPPSLFPLLFVISLFFSFSPSAPPEPLPEEAQEYIGADYYDILGLERSATGNFEESWGFPVIELKP